MASAPPPPPVVYACVSRGVTVLAEYAFAAGNANVIALQCLDKVCAARPAGAPASPGGGAPAAASPSQQQQRYTYTCDGHNVCFLVDAAGFTYCAVTPATLGRAAPFAYLTAVAADFVARHGAAGAAAAAHALDRAFAPRLAALAPSSSSSSAAGGAPSSSSASPSRIASVQAAVDGVKAVMVDNIEKVLERGERIELLVDKTDGLRDAAGRFQAAGRQLRQRMWWNNVKVKLVLLLLVVALALVIWLVACSGGSCRRKHG